MTASPSPPTVWFPSSAAPAIGTNFVSVADGHLSLDGTRVSFFGVNLDNFAVLTPLVWNNGSPLLDPGLCESVRQQLDNLVDAGVRAVRIHGLDLTNCNNAFWAFGQAAVPASQQTTRQLDPNFLLAFGFLWNELRKRNIRVVMTLHYRRTLVPNDLPSWPCPTFRECLSAPFPGTCAGEMHPWFWFDSGLQQLHAEFNQQLLRWVNPLTGIAIGDDPTLMVVILQNERSLVKDDPYNYPNQPVLQGLWQAARMAWKSANNIGGTDINKVQWQQCLSSIETSVLNVQAANVRSLTKALVIAGTYYGNGPYSMLVGPNAAGDVNDFHFYSRYSPTDLNGFLAGRTTADPRTRFATVAAGCAWGKPLFCTEWGPVGQYPPLARDPDSERALALAAVVKTAIAQDADAIFLYSWGHSPLTDGQYSKHTCYDFRDDVVLLQGLQAQVARFHDLSLRPTTNSTITLTADKLYGCGVGPAYQLPGPYTDADLYAAPADQKIAMTPA